MKYISEERLIAAIEVFDCDRRTTDIISSIIDECKEINPWKLIDENTPKDRPLLLFFPCKRPYSQQLKQTINEHNGYQRIN